MVPLLTAVGHEVIGLARPGGDTTPLEAAGARMAVAEVLDPTGCAGWSGR
ncbi:hypothetical protein AB0L30_35355 [Microbispora rosea]